MDKRVWLTHPETGGNFHCPAEAVEAWQAMGWVPGEAPVEVNPAVAERIAYQREQQAAAAATKTTRTDKAARRGESAGVSDG